MTKRVTRGGVVGGKWVGVWVIYIFFNLGKKNG